jgi:hypothetical protein
LDLYSLSSPTFEQAAAACPKAAREVKSGGYRFCGSWGFTKRCEDLLRDVEWEREGLKWDRGSKMSLQDWSALAWYHVVGSGNLDHLRAGVRVERLRTWGGAFSYCAKYLGKEDDGFLADIALGRSWGIFNRAAIPWAKMVELQLDNQVGVQLRRIARRYLERQFGRRVRAPYGITLYCDVSNIRRLWARPPPPPF